MKFTTPLSKAYGLGSAKAGSHHWWWQRMTAVALVPLCIWLAAAAVALPGADYATVVDWLQQPWNGALLVSFLLFAFYHAALGVQIVVEDYVHDERVKIPVLIAVKLGMIFLALAAVIAALKVIVAG